MVFGKRHGRNRGKRGGDRDITVFLAHISPDKSLLRKSVFLYATGLKNENKQETTIDRFRARWNITLFR